MAGKAAGVARVVRCVMDPRQIRETHAVEDGQPEHENAECRPPYRQGSYGNIGVSEDA